MAAVLAGPVFNFWIYELPIPKNIYPVLYVPSFHPYFFFNNRIYEGAKFVKIVSSTYELVAEVSFECAEFKMRKNWY